MIRRRAPLKRTPLKRASIAEPSGACTFRVPRARIKPKRSKPRRVSVLRDRGYMDWLRESSACLVCCKLALAGAVSGIGWEARIIDPCHTVNNGRASKGPDSSCIPLCRGHHDEMDGRRGTKITTKVAFAEKYGLDLEREAAAHYAVYQIVKEAA